MDGWSRMGCKEIWILSINGYCFFIIQNKNILISFLFVSIAECLLPTSYIFIASKPKIGRRE